MDNGVLVPNRFAFEKAELLFWPAFFAPTVADNFLQKLLAIQSWQQTAVRMFGRVIDEPRLTCHCGGVAYAYSGRTLPALPCPEVVAELMAYANGATGEAFNTALLNRYRGGADYMGWHADNERMLGPSPVVASFSFGATRVFKVRPKEKGSEAGLDLLLPHGSLLVMCAGMQAHYQHALPKTKRPVSERVNVTFRKVVA